MARRTPPSDYDGLPSSAEALAELRAVPDPTSNAALLAEAQTLGHILNGRLEPADVPPDAFTDYRHQAIHRATLDLNGTGHDPLTVLHHLQTTGQLQRDIDHAGGILFDLYSQATGDPCYWRRTAVQAAERRRLTATLTRAQQALSGADSPEDVEASIWATLFDLVDPATRHADNPTGEHDLAYLLEHDPPPVQPPSHCRRSDGHALFYAGRVNGIYGEPETGKSWVAQHTIVEALAGGQHAALIDVDHNGPELTIRNLLLLGATRAQLADRDLFRYLEPDDPTQLLAAVDTLAAWQPAVAVLDSIGEILPMLGVKSVDNDEITTALRRVASPLADAGACVITIDHLPKDSDAKTSGYAIGGTAKKRALDGSYIEARAKKKPAPGQIGKTMLYVSKDRPGGLRQHSSGGSYAGVFVLDSTHPDTIAVTVELDSPITTDGIFRPTHLMERVSAFLAANPWSSKRQIRDGVQGKEAAIMAALDRLVEEGFVKTGDGARGAVLHYLVATYTEAEDDPS